MSRKLLFVAPLLLIAAVVLAQGEEKGAPAAEAPAAPAKVVADAGAFSLKLLPANDLTRMCPEGALAFVRIRNLQAFDAEITNLVAAVMPEMAPMASLTANLGGMLGNPELEGMDLEKPAGIALMMGAGGPSPVMILPVADQAKVTAKVGENPMVLFLGDYMLWAMNPDDLEGIKVGEKPVGAAASLVDGDVSIALNMPALAPLMEPMFEQFDAMLEMFKSQMPGPMGEMYGDMATEMKTMLTDADQIGMAMDLTDGKLDFVYRYVAKEGSATAKKIASEQIVRKSLLGYVQHSGFMAMEMKTTGQSLWDQFGKMYGTMLADADPALLEMLKKSIMQMQGMAFGMSLDGGMAGTSIAGVENEEEYAKILDEMPNMFSGFMDSYKKMMPPEMDMPMDMELIVGEPWEHNGVKVRPYSFKITLKETEELPPEALASMKEMMTKMFGGESMNIEYALANGHFMATIGPKSNDEMKSLIDRVKAGKAGEWPASMVAATEGFPSVTTSVFMLDFGDVLKLVADLDVLPIPEPVRAQLKNPPAGLGVSGFTTNDSKATGYGMRIDLMTIAAYIKSFM